MGVTLSRCMGVVFSSCQKTSPGNTKCLIRIKGGPRVLLMEKRPKKGMAGMAQTVILVAALPILLIYQQDKTKVKGSIIESEIHELVQTGS